MSDFSFTSTAECEQCGAYLSASDEDCDHDGNPVNTHVFKKVGRGRESLTGVESTIQHKWYALEAKVGDEWIEYQWLGTRETINRLLRGSFSSVSELPVQAMSTDAPADIAESTK